VAAAQKATSKVHTVVDVMGQQWEAVLACLLSNITSLLRQENTNGGGGWC
jgi:hypothetical protein